jgi:hypothetical protein
MGPTCPESETMKTIERTLSLYAEGAMRPEAYYRIPSVCHAKKKKGIESQGVGVGIPLSTITLWYYPTRDQNKVT